MEKIISTLKGARGQGNIYKDEDGFVYWKKLDCKLYITVRCSLWKSG